MLREGFPRPSLTYSLLVFPVNVAHFHRSLHNKERAPLTYVYFPKNYCQQQFFHSPVKDASLFQDVSQVNVGVQEVRVQRHSFLEVMNGEPDLALCIEHTAEVAPGHRKIRTRFDGL